MIRALAVSLSGSEHIVTGGVRNKESYAWETEEEARAHLDRIQWTHVRFQVDGKVLSDGKVIVTWDNQSKTEHVPGSGSFTYLKGGPAVGEKLSKSKIAADGSRQTLRDSTPKKEEVLVHDVIIDKEPIDVKGK